MFCLSYCLAYLRKAFVFQSRHNDNDDGNSDDEGDDIGDDHKNGWFLLSDYCVRNCLVPLASIITFNSCNNLIHKYPHFAEELNESQRS